MVKKDKILSTNLFLTKSLSKTEIFMIYDNKNKQLTK